MQQYGMLQALYMAFYSSKLYRDVAQHWGGRVFLYLLFLLTLSWVAFVVQMQYQMEVGYPKISAKYVPQVPVMTFKDGVLQTPENRPYIITDPDNHETIAIIDTSGKYKTLKEAHANLLITAHDFQLDSHQQEEKAERLEKFPTTLNTVVDPKEIDKGLSHFLHFIWIFLLSFLVLATFIYRVVQTLIYALFGKLFAYMNDVVLSYFQLMQLSIIALTPVIIIASIVDFFNLHFQHEGQIYFLIAMLYLLFGVRSNKRLAK